MFKRITFIFLAIYSAIFLYPLILHASLNETLPTYHWSYKYIYEIQSRGFCLDLGQMNLPYLRGDVAASIIKAKKYYKNRGKPRSASTGYSKKAFA